MIDGFRDESACDRLGTCCPKPRVAGLNPSDESLSEKRAASVVLTFLLRMKSWPDARDQENGSYVETTRRMASLRAADVRPDSSPGRPGARERAATGELGVAG